MYCSGQSSLSRHLRLYTILELQSRCRLRNLRTPQAGDSVSLARAGCAYREKAGTKRSCWRDGSELKQTLSRRQSLVPTMYPRQHRGASVTTSSPATAYSRRATPRRAIRPPPPCVSFGLEQRVSINFARKDYEAFLFRGRLYVVRWGWS